jgi:hypothetical protein
MKLLLSAFEQLSGLKINFHKSEIFCLGEPRIMNHSTNICLGAKRTFPFSYLGIPMHYTGNYITTIRR